MATDQAYDLDLSEVWDALTAAGAQVYEWTTGGVATGCQVVRLGDRHAITVDDCDGYKLIPADDLDDADLVPTDEYDDDAAQREASDLTGWFGIVGLPGSVHHDFEWFETETEAGEWVDRRRAEVLDANPVMGTIEAEVVSAADAFDRAYRDGQRVYFQEQDGGVGFEPRRGEA